MRLLAVVVLMTEVVIGGGLANSLLDVPFRTMTGSPEDRRGRHRRKAKLTAGAYSGTDIILKESKQIRAKAASVTFASVTKALHGRNRIWSDDDLRLTDFLNLTGIHGQAAFSPTPSPGFVKYLMKRCRPRFVVEVGSFVGSTTITIAESLDRIHGAGDVGPFVLAIDTWLGDAYMWSSKRATYASAMAFFHGKPQLYYQFLSNVLWANMSHRVVPLPLSSNEAARVLDFHDFRPDLVYVDASHDALDVLADLEHYYFLLQCNGSLFGDDYHWPGVSAAVNHFVQRRRLRLEVYMIRRAEGHGERFPPGTDFTHRCSLPCITKWVVPQKDCAQAT